MQQGYNAMAMPTPSYGYPVLPQHIQNHGGSVNHGPRNDERRKSDAVVSQLSSVLEQADKSELQELHDSEENLHALLDKNSEVQQLQVERELQLAGNRSLAEHNMKQAPRLKECKERLGNLYNQWNEQTKTFEENKRNLESLSGSYNPDTIMALLQTSVAQSEESSEKTADSFMDGELSVDDFLDKYLKERTILHMRHTKVDKMKEMMRRR